MCNVIYRLKLTVELASYCGQFKDLAACWERFVNFMMVFTPSLKEGSSRQVSGQRWWKSSLKVTPVNLGNLLRFKQEMIGWLNGCIKILLFSLLLLLQCWILLFDNSIHVYNEWFLITLFPHSLLSPSFNYPNPIITNFSRFMTFVFVFVAHLVQPGFSLWWPNWNYLL